MAGSTSKGRPTGAFELEVVLEETSPRIWRRIVVSPKTALSDLHQILQVAMGWTDSHLHQFQRGDEIYADPSHEIEDAMAESKVTVRDLLEREGDEIGYVYDFGDDWTHTIRLVGMLSPSEAGALPRCVAGERACPPEDCGGVPGYEDLLEILKDPKNDEYEERMEWLGGAFDPDAFDLKAVTRELRQLGG